MKDFLEQDILLRTVVGLLKCMNQMHGLKNIGELQLMFLYSISDTERGQFRVSFKMGSTLLPGTTTTISEMDSDRSGLMASSFNSNGILVFWL